MQPFPSPPHEWVGRPPTWRIFISSTSQDLFAHRAALATAIGKMDQVAIGMERFAAQISDATTVSTAEVARADLFVLVLAWRYGFIPEGETCSITQLEYQEALRLGLPILVFLADPSTENPAAPDNPFRTETRDDEHLAQLLVFRGLVSDGSRHTVDWFTTPDNLAATVTPALFRAIRALAPRPRPPRDRPPQAPAFVGRKHEREQLRYDLLCGESIGLSSLVAGMPGVGKSALAAQVVAELAADPATFPGGITFVLCNDRAGLEGLAWLYDHLLAAWEAPLPPERLAQLDTLGIEIGVEARERALRTRLRPDDDSSSPPALLLLDNVEPSLPVARALRLLSPLGMTCLLTARFESTGLPLQIRRLDVLDPTAATALFGERYSEAGGQWDEERDREAAQRIVQTLGRLPLAIELEAARAGRLSVVLPELAEQLAQETRLGHLADPLDPTHSVRYVFERTLAALSPVRRLCFAALSVPEGPVYPLPIAQHILQEIVAADEVAPEVSGMSKAEEADTALDSLQAFSLLTLVSLSLGSAELHATGDSSSAHAPRHGGAQGSATHVRLHPLLHTYARELWQAASLPLHQAGIEGLVLGVADYAIDHGSDFRTLSQDEAMIRSALVTPAAQQSAFHFIILAITFLSRYLYEGGHWHLGMELFQAQVTAARKLGDRFTERKALNHLGLVANGLGRNEEAKRYFEQALIIAREEEDLADEAATLNNLGMLANNLGQVEEAKRYLEQALAVHEKVDWDRRLKGRTLNNLGLVAEGMLQVEEARRYFEQALVIAREEKDRVGEGRALHNLGDTAIYFKQVEEAKRYLEQALVVSREVGDLVGEVAALDGLGSLAIDRGQVDEGKRYSEQALVIAREMGYRTGEGIALNTLGSLAIQLGQMEEAKRCFEQALAIFEATEEAVYARLTRINLLLLNGDLSPPPAPKRPWWRFRR